MEEVTVVEEVEVMNSKTQTMETFTRNPTRKKMEWELELLMIVSSGHLVVLMMVRKLLSWDVINCEVKIMCLL